MKNQQKRLSIVSQALLLHAISKAPLVLIKRDVGLWILMNSHATLPKCCKN
jgi:hypothetical protein